MKDLVEKMKRREIVTGIVFLVLGFVLIIWPGVSIKIACRVVGVLMILYGAIQVIAYLREEEKTFVSGGIFTAGIVIGLLGIWIASKPEMVVSALPIIVGLIIALHGIQNIAQAFTLKQQGDQNWWMAAVIGVITAVFGLILFCNPFAAVETLIRFIGIFMVCDGGSNIWIQWRIQAKG